MITAGPSTEELAELADNLANHPDRVGLQFELIQRLVAELVERRGLDQHRTEAWRAYSTEALDRGEVFGWSCLDCPSTATNLLDATAAERGATWHARHPHGVPAAELTFAEFRAANVSRCRRWHPGFPGTDDWTLADWSNALAGEAGELANVIKKIRRLETGHHSRKPAEQDRDELVRQAGEEIGDVYAYLDLLAAKLQLPDIGLVAAAKFNAVSIREQFQERLPMTNRPGAEPPSAADVAADTTTDADGAEAAAEAIEARLRQFPAQPPWTMPGQVGWGATPRELADAALAAARPLIAAQIRGLAAREVYAISTRYGDKYDRGRTAMNVETWTAATCTKLLRALDDWAATNGYEPTPASMSGAQ